MERIVIAGAGRIVDGKGTMDACRRVEHELAANGLKDETLVIDPLRAGWDTPLAAGHYRSGCGPLEALADGCRLVASDPSRYVVISGEDPLRTGYSREERHRLMAIYGPDWPLPEAYTALAREFMARHGIAEDEFRLLAELLRENYTRTARRLNLALPGERWFGPVTSLFRGVDCANPVVDFAGRLVLCRADAATSAGIAREQQVAIAGIGVAALPGDGPSFIPAIASFDHLAEAFRQACTQAQLDFNALFLASRAALDVYTCYPIVPLAFFLVTGLAATPVAIPELLATHEVTVTGGMNIGRAAWNNPCLNALIAVRELLLAAGPGALAGVHGNGGLGYRQGFAILMRLS